MALKPGQLKCIQTLDRPIVVAAGAGSGKTFTLTKRIVGALESGYVDDIGQVCAITFTNKAAAELKSRVKAELRAVGLVEQSLKADDAWISTIHGMCARMLRAHAVELGVDPAFKMADAALAGRLRDQSVDEVLAAAETGAAEHTALQALFAEYPARSQGPGGSSVEGMLQRLIDLAGADARGMDAFKAPAASARPASLARAALDAFDGLLQAAQAEKPSKSRDEWMGKTADALAAAHAALDAGACDALECLRFMAELAVSKRFGGAAFKAQVDEVQPLVDACVMELRLAAAAPHLHTLLDLARQALARFRDKKRRAGVLDNNDLLVLASRALEGNPSMAADYANRFRLVMVDEFQDTDQMQVDMIKRIAGPGASRLCTVGDAQQSIYRFRGADVSVYRRHLESVRAADAQGIILLPDNFRSHADVLSLVDRVFEQPGMFGGEFMSLAPGRDDAQVARPFPAGQPRVLVQQVTKARTGGVPSEDVVRVQAQRVAAAFADLREAGHPAGDMAVLLGRMVHANVYAQALREQGLACVISGGSVFSDTPEAHMVRSLARVAANPADTRALQEVLSGPLFRVTDDDLLLLATEGVAAGGFRPRSLDKGLRALSGASAEAALPDGFAPSPQLHLAVRVLGNLVRDADRLGMAPALMRAVVDSGWASRLEAQGAEGLAAAGNAYKAIRLMEDLEASGELGPVGAVRAFEEALACAKEAPGALSAKGGDFVRIMTVHASKGLEFPIVAVAEFKDVHPGVSRLLALPGTDGIALSLDLGRSLERIGGAVAKLKTQPLYQELLEGLAGEDELKARAFQAQGALEQRAAMSEYARIGDEEESKRLLYVALTRAKEFLVIAMGGARTKDNPNGVPANCMAALVQALEKSGQGFGRGTASYSFGGSAPALVEHIALVKDEDLGRGQGECSGAEGGGIPGHAGPDAGPEGVPAGQEAAPLAGFAVPAPVFRLPVAHRRYQDAHEGIFSYSSVSEASHAGDLPERLAARFATSCDAAAPLRAAVGVAPTAGDMPAAGDARAAREQRAWWREEAALALAGEDDEGPWASLSGAGGDADKATSLGTAFHRLAQQAVRAWRAPAPLAMPAPARIRAMCRACGLDARQRARLNEALERWFGSAQAAQAAAMGRLQAEVPFMMPVRLGDGTDTPPGGNAAARPGASGVVFLEGEIDLLAMDAQGTRALVVDYKTGGHPDETPQALRCKHVLQASCYAYALLLRGVQEVEASFVRVERSCASDPLQPQCVRYRFTANCRSYLERAIAQAYRLAHG